MNLEKRIAAFISLGTFLNAACSAEVNDDFYLKFLLLEFQELMVKEKNNNNFFTEDNVVLAIKSVASMLDESHIKMWLKNYESKLNEPISSVRIGVIMAGNIPMVGFHDMLCVLIAGHIFVGKSSSGDAQLLKHLAKVLISIAPEFGNKIEFTDRVTDVAAIIATGGNNTGRYFEYYFSKYPHIIRKNRNAVGVFNGKETKEDFIALGKDIFQYFGLGCRSVSKIYVPEGYDFIPFIEALSVYENVADHTKYRNNYDYNKALLLINRVHHLDSGFLLIKEDKAMVSPISVLFYETYVDKSALENLLGNHASELQCIVASANTVENSIPFGTAQCPALWDYPDGVDTLKFVLDQGRNS